MPKSVPIRIRKSDEQEYRRLVRNAKAKVRRTLKKYNRNLENEINLQDISSFKTRKEYNKWKEDIKSFTNRANLKYQYVKNDYDVVLSKKQVLELKDLTKQAQRNYDKNRPKVEDLPLLRGDKKVGTVGQRMQQMKRPNDFGSRPRDFDYRKIRTLPDVKRIRRTLQKRSDPSYYDKGIDIMRENFIAHLEFTFNSDADELIKELRAMSLQEFYALYKMNESGSFNFSLYSSQERPGSTFITTGNNLDENLEEMMSDVERFKNGQIDMDFTKI